MAIKETIWPNVTSHKYAKGANSEKGQILCYRNGKRWIIQT